jgi:hypothetical protein
MAGFDLNNLLEHSLRYEILRFQSVITTTCIYIGLLAVTSPRRPPSVK